MSMLQAITSVYSHFAVFSGRARRSEYWYFVLFNMLVGFVYGFLTGLFDRGFLNTILTAAYDLFALVNLIPTLAVVWRRLHDTGRSGGCYFIFLVPLIGWILLLIWLCTKGQQGPNEYGPDPKGYQGVVTEKEPWEY